MRKITKVTTAEKLSTLLAKNELSKEHNAAFELDFLTEDIYVRFCFGDINKPIVIAFSNAGESATDAKLKNSDYAPWGYDFIKKEGFSVISISCYKKSNWFRNSLTIELLKVFSYYIKPYKEKLGYGGSMGGYAVGAYCDLLKLDRCLLFNPISTLNPDKVPSEIKHPAASQDWKSEFNDGAITLTPKYIIFDPLLARDKMHAHRYLKATYIHFRGVGHGLPKHLLATRTLKESFYCLVNDQAPNADFYRKIRNGKRKYNHYFKFITSNKVKQINPKRKKVIQRYYEIYLSSLTAEDRADLLPKQNSNLHNMTETDINYLRDLSLKLEKTDLKTSLRLMLIVKKLRPNGPLIKKKIKQYQEQLREQEV